MRASCGEGMPPATISKAKGSRCRNAWSRRATVSVIGGRTSRNFIVDHLCPGPLNNAKLILFILSPYWDYSYSRESKTRLTGANAPTSILKLPLLRSEEHTSEL